MSDEKTVCFSGAEIFDISVLIGMANRGDEAHEPGKAACVARVRAKLVAAGLLSELSPYPRAPASAREEG